MSAPNIPFRLQVDGGDGVAGTMSYSWRLRQAGAHSSGNDGRSANGPGGGGGGGFISVMLSPSAVWAGGIHVEGIGSWQGEQLEVPPDTDLHLSARGGNGGDGGVGEDGQDGGRGRDGVNATKDSSATDGGCGKDGGSGGYGTNGADGGNGGTIEVTVREEHMNLLIAVLWDVAGGNGGAAGAHGIGGASSKGGKGGDGIKWEVEVCTTRFVDGKEFNYYETDYHSKPAGYGGRAGRPGATPSEPLYDGNGGLDGVFSFFILRRDGTREQYHGRYDLQVAGFDVVDENDDGVYEPGEHIFVEGIRGHNAGVMPSPSLTSIPLTMRSSGWLDPTVSQNSVCLPTSIPPGATWEAPGSIKAFIKQEPSSRTTPSYPLLANDHVDVVATMPGLNRLLKDFIFHSPLLVRYPLELLPPVYLPTVAIGDEFTVQWKVRNMSRVTYGTDAQHPRVCGARVRKTGAFDFTGSVSDENETYRYIEAVAPGCDAVFNQVFHVSDAAEAFSRGYLYLEMLLGEPGDDPAWFSTLPFPVQGLRLISRFDLEFQISAAYRHTPHASYLLVVNTGTPGSLIREIVAYVQEKLHKNVDVFNLCLSGNLDDEEDSEGRNVLMKYKGKTIILLANPTDYFGEKGRFAYEFIDPWSASLLLRARTAILLLGLPDVNHLTRTWTKMVATPEFAVDTTGADGSVHVPDVNALLSRLRETNLAGNEQSSAVFKTHTVTVKKVLFKSRQSSTTSCGKKLAKRLGKLYPTQSYGLAADYTVSSSTTGSKAQPARIMIREGLASDVTVLASSISCTAHMGCLPPAIEYLLAATLPFEQRFRMLWEGVETGCQRLQLSEKARQFLVHSLQYDILLETSTFTSKSPLRDPATKLSAQVLLPTLTLFFATAKASGVNISSLPPDQEWIVDILVWVYADTTTGNTLLGGGARKKLVRNFVTKSIAALSSSSSSSFESELKRRIPPIQSYLKQLRSRKDAKTLSRPPAVTGTIAAIADTVGLSDGRATGDPFVDVGALMRATAPTTFFWNETERADALAARGAFMHRKAVGEERSKAQIQDMVVNLEEVGSEEGEGVVPAAAPAA